MFLFIIEMIGAVACGISGMRLAALKRFDWFGAYIVGLVTAAGGGTLRDLLLGIPVFWVADSHSFFSYLIATAVCLPTVIILRRQLVRGEKMLLAFDAVGLAMFTVIGIEKAIGAGEPMWIAVAMGLVTGAFGGVLRDILINQVPLIFRKDIYAMASLLGGLAYWGVKSIGGTPETAAIICAAIIIATRVLALRFNWQLPVLQPRVGGEE
jgi:uncharacterized membrane protein YeiH